MIFGKYINKYYFKYLYILLLGLLSLAAVDYAQLLIPELYKYIINGIGNGFNTINGVDVPFNFDFVLDKICLPMIIVILVIVTGRFLWRICFFGAGAKVEEDLRLRMFDRCKNLSASYYQKNKVGNLMSLFTNDLETVQDCFGWGVMMLCDALFLGGMSFYKMVALKPLLALFSLIPLACMLVAATVIGNYMEKKWETRQEAFSQLSDFSQENFSGIAVIKAFVKEGKELSAFKKLNKHNEDVNVEFVKASTILNIAITLFIESVVCVILGYGGYLVFAGSFNAGELMEFIGYFNAIIWPVMAISELIGMKSRGQASLRRISELLSASQDVKDRDGAKPLGNARGEIEFKNLTFAYPDSEIPSLKNVSFKIEAGENVGIVGRTGSGKTTVADLILRTYNVPDGTVFIDGNDVNDVTIESVRKNAAYVPQDNFLFSDTIENNIAFASDEVSFDAVVRSAKLADVNGNIAEFRDGYKTVLGERGVTVSGGQKQRISIARAMMKNAPVLILDDAVSAVDTETEKKILENLRLTRKGKTTILIAHRISTVKGMDKIIYLEDGAVAAIGTHEELMNTCPEYKRTVELQIIEEKKKKEENENA
jgi:ATP-binding cassette subfamily B protein